MALNEGEDLDMVLEDFTEDADKAAYIVGHNISFDLAIMQTAYKNASMEFPLEGKTKFDTMTSSTQWCKLPKANGAGYKWPKLEELYYKLFDENFDNAHSASADTEATMKSFFELVDKGVIKGVIHDSPRAANRHPLDQKGPESAKEIQKITDQEALKAKAQKIFEEVRRKAEEAKVKEAAKQKGNYKDGKKDGKWTWWNENGQKESEKN